MIIPQGGNGSSPWLASPSHYRRPCHGCGLPEILCNQQGMLASFTMMMITMMTMITMRIFIFHDDNHDPDKNVPQDAKWSLVSVIALVTVWAAWFALVRLLDFRYKYDIIIIVTIIITITIIRVGKCQIFYTDQYQQTRFYPEKIA